MFEGLLRIDENGTTRLMETTDYIPTGKSIFNSLKMGFSDEQPVDEIGVVVNKISSTLVFKAGEKIYFETVVFNPKDFLNLRLFKSGIGAPVFYRVDKDKVQEFKNFLLRQISEGIAIIPLELVKAKDDYGFLKKTTVSKFREDFGFVNLVPFNKWNLRIVPARIAEDPIYAFLFEKGLTKKNDFVLFAREGVVTSFMIIEEGDKGIILAEDNLGLSKAIAYNSFIASISDSKTLSEVEAFLENDNMVNILSILPFKCRRMKSNQKFEFVDIKNGNYYSTTIRLKQEDFEKLKKVVAHLKEDSDLEKIPQNSLSIFALRYFGGFSDNPRLISIPVLVSKIKDLEVDGAVSSTLIEPFLKTFAFLDLLDNAFATVRSGIDIALSNFGEIKSYSSLFGLIENGRELLEKAKSKIIDILLKEKDASLPEDKKKEILRFIEASSYANFRSEFQTLIRRYFSLEGANLDNFNQKADERYNVFRQFMTIFDELSKEISTNIIRLNEGEKNRVNAKNKRLIDKIDNFVFVLEKLFEVLVREENKFVSGVFAQDENRKRKYESLLAKVVDLFLPINLENRKKKEIFGYFGALIGKDPKDAKTRAFVVQNIYEYYASILPNTAETFLSTYEFLVKLSSISLDSIRFLLSFSPSFKKLIDNKVSSEILDFARIFFFMIRKWYKGKIESIQKKYASKGGSSIIVSKETVQIYDEETDEIEGINKDIEIINTISGAGEDSALELLGENKEEGFGSEEERLLIEGLMDLYLRILQFMDSLDGAYDTISGFWTSFTTIYKTVIEETYAYLLVSGIVAPPEKESSFEEKIEIVEKNAHKLTEEQIETLISKVKLKLDTQDAEVFDFLVLYSFEKMIGELSFAFKSLVRLAKAEGRRILYETTLSFVSALLRHFEPIIKKYAFLLIAAPQKALSDLAFGSESIEKGLRAFTRSWYLSIYKTKNSKFNLIREYEYSLYKLYGGSKEAVIRKVFFDAIKRAEEKEALVLRWEKEFSKEYLKYPYFVYDGLYNIDSKRLKFYQANDLLSILEMLILGKDLPIKGNKKVKDYYASILKFYFVSTIVTNLASKYRNNSDFLLGSVKVTEGEEGFKCDISNENIKYDFNQLKQLEIENLFTKLSSVIFGRSKQLDPEIFERIEQVVSDIEASNLDLIVFVKERLNDKMPKFIYVVEIAKFLKELKVENIIKEIETIKPDAIKVKKQFLEEVYDIFLNFEETLAIDVEKINNSKNLRSYLYESIMSGVQKSIFDYATLLVRAYSGVYYQRVTSYLYSRKLILDLTRTLPSKARERSAEITEFRILTQSTVPFLMASSLPILPIYEGISIDYSGIMSGILIEYLKNILGIKGIPFTGIPSWIVGILPRLYLFPQGNPKEIEMFTERLYRLIHESYGVYPLKENRKALSSKIQIAGKELAPLKTNLIDVTPEILANEYREYDTIRDINRINEIIRSRTNIEFTDSLRGLVIAEALLLILVKLALMSEDKLITDIYMLAKPLSSETSTDIVKNIFAAYLKEEEFDFNEIGVKDFVKVTKEVAQNIESGFEEENLYALFPSSAATYLFAIDYCLKLFEYQEMLYNYSDSISRSNEKELMRNKLWKYAMNTAEEINMMLRLVYFASSIRVKDEPKLWNKSSFDILRLMTKALFGYKEALKKLNVKNPEFLRYWKKNKYVVNNNLKTIPLIDLYNEFLPTKEMKKFFAYLKTISAYLRANISDLQRIDAIVKKAIS